MKERIIKVMEHEGMGQAQFSAAIGIQRAAMSHIISGRNNPSLDVMLKILHRFPYIDPDWLLFGKGEMLRAGAEGNVLFRQSPSSTPPEIRLLTGPEKRILLLPSLPPCPPFSREVRPKGWSVSWFSIPTIRSRPSCPKSRARNNLAEMRVFSLYLCIFVWNFCNNLI